jgi:N-acetyl-gamma-glutamyl-phosphate reductase
MRAAVVGASGYTGLELIRILLRHPIFELVAVHLAAAGGPARGRSLPRHAGHRDLGLSAAAEAARHGSASVTAF